MVGQGNAVVPRLHFSMSKNKNRLFHGSDVTEKVSWCCEYIVPVSGLFSSSNGRPDGICCNCSGFATKKVRKEIVGSKIGLIEGLIMMIQAY